MTVQGKQKAQYSPKKNPWFPAISGKHSIVCCGQVLSCLNISLQKPLQRRPFNWVIQQSSRAMLGRQLDLGTRSGIKVDNKRFGEDQ